jgi:hypothetical protein
MKTMSKSSKPLKLKIYGPLGDIINEFELDWSHDQMERYASSHRFILEGDIEVAYHPERDNNGLELKEKEW